MQALPFIRQLRSQLQIEIAALPGCLELEKTERMLGIYEQIVIQRGLQQKYIAPKVKLAFDRLIAVARESSEDGKAPKALPGVSRRAAVAAPPFATRRASIC
jgi:hypothetical protein